MHVHIAKNKLNYKKLISCLKHLIYVMAFLFLNSQAIYSSSDREILAEKTDLYRELVSVAIGWKNAVLNKDIDTLSSYALPESRKYVRDEFNDKESKLYRLFYGDQRDKQKGKSSIYDTLSNIKQLKIIVERDKRLENFGNGVRTYYYDESKVKPKIPLTDNEVQLLMDKGELLLMFFFKIGDHWYVSYEFSNGDDD